MEKKGKVPMQSKTYAPIALYGVLHAMVDATCAAIIFSSMAAFGGKLDEFGIYVVLYNVLAFGLQVPFGAAVDRFGKSRAVVVLGCLLTATAAVCAISLPLIVAATLAGFGNALFHVGGGVAMLRIGPGRATIPGIYVAPGAIGLLVGTLIGKGGYYQAWLFVGILIIGALFAYKLQVPEGQDDGIRMYINTRIQGKLQRTQRNWQLQTRVADGWVDFALILLFASVALRALVGIALAYTWKSQTGLLVAFTCAVALGKAAGGILADRFGWIQTSTMGLVLSAPMLYLGFDSPMAAILGALLFNLTMPVTLTAMANLLPKREGLAFGLTTLALLIGTYPVFTGVHFWFYGKWAVPVLVFVMAIVLYAGLRLYEKDRMEYEKRCVS